jgi:hypothetical protein
MDKLSFNGVIKSIQPRIRLPRSFDEASYTYYGGREYLIDIYHEPYKALGKV